MLIEDEPYLIIIICHICLLKIVFLLAVLFEVKCVYVVTESKNAFMFICFVNIASCKQLLMRA
jgi:hypothetical protein